VCLRQFKPLYVRLLPLSEVEVAVEAGQKMTHLLVCPVVLVVAVA
jgi:hypothetical protein